MTTKNTKEAEAEVKAEATEATTEEATTEVEATTEEAVEEAETTTEATEETTEATEEAEEATEEPTGEVEVQTSSSTSGTVVDAKALEDFETIDKARSVIETCLGLVKSEVDVEALKYRGKTILEIIDAAKKLVKGSELKRLALLAWTVQEANRVAGLVWRTGDMTDEAEEAFRALPMLADCSQRFKDAQQPLEDEQKAIEEARRVLMAKTMERDVFVAVLSGYTEQEAMGKYREYQKELADLAKSLGQDEE